MSFLKRFFGGKDEALEAAIAEVEGRYATIMLEAEALPDPAEFQRKAGRLKDRLDALVREAKPGDPVARGRITQLGSEIAALRSRMLQKRE